jgi:hypothetical protein
MSARVTDESVEHHADHGRDRAGIVGLKRAQHLVRHGAVHLRRDVVQGVDTDDALSPTAKAGGGE